MKAGTDYIGVGCGGLAINEKDEVLLLKRGKNSKNEVGMWSKFGGQVEFGQTVEETLKKEAMEEIGCEIEILELINYVNHIIPEEKQHWVSFNFLVKIIGEPKNMEPHKCDEMGWFHIDNLPKNTSPKLILEPLEIYRKKYGI